MRGRDVYRPPDWAIGTLDHLGYQVTSAVTQRNRAPNRLHAITAVMHGYQGFALEAGAETERSLRASDNELGLSGPASSGRVLRWVPTL